MYSLHANTALPVLGLPIRRSASQRLFSASSRLIAAVHVLHRLQMPRHPPCALHILTVIDRSGFSLRFSPGDCIFPPSFLNCLACAVFKVRGRRARWTSFKSSPLGWSLKTQQRDDLQEVRPDSVDISGTHGGVVPACDRLGFIYRGSLERR